MKREFEAKKIVVIGATGSIGTSIARHLDILGASLCLVGRDESKLRELSRELSGCHTSISLDLSEVGSVDTLFREIDRSMLPLDGLVHAAGRLQIRPLSLMREDELRKDLNSAVLFSLGLGRYALKRRCFTEGGSIVFVSSVAGVAATKGMAEYSVTKSAMLAACRALSVELAQRRVRCNTILSGGIESEMHQNMMNIVTEKSMEEYKNKHLLGFGSGEDIKYLTELLLSKRMSWTTGASFCVDGGYTAFK